MAPTSKLKVRVKNNILKVSQTAQKPDEGYAIYFSPTFKTEEVESQISPTHPMLELPSCHKEELGPLSMLHFPS